MPHGYPVLVSDHGYVRHVAESITFPFRAERAVSPVDGSELWVVLDAELVRHREASDFLRCLDAAGRSPHTLRAYAGRTAAFLSWCRQEGIDWATIGLADLARFKHWLEVTPCRGDDAHLKVPRPAH